MLYETEATGRFFFFVLEHKKYTISACVSLFTEFVADN
jgi:hypothetical protein